jgi:hypothetical protein
MLYGHTGRTAAPYFVSTTTALTQEHPKALVIYIYIKKGKCPSLYLSKKLLERKRKRPYIFQAHSVLTPI